VASIELATFEEPKDDPDRGAEFVLSHLKQLHREYSGAFVRISSHETLKEHEALTGGARLTDFDRSELHDSGDVLDIRSLYAVAGSVRHAPKKLARQRPWPTSFSGLLLGRFMGVEGRHAPGGSHLVLSRV
jgi:hypothetical protein